MSSHRPYRPAFGIEKALEEILSKKGILYDPRVAEAFENAFKKGTLELKNG
jgi:HD-GYP domain-containing protein (c-di-GMP phosphodiesterase class II)